MCVSTSPGEIISPAASSSSSPFSGVRVPASASVWIRPSVMRRSTRRSVSDAGSIRKPFFISIIHPPFAVKYTVFLIEIQIY